jgi:hypothetical protein
MLQPHQRAALIPNDPGVNWPQFLGERFVQSNGSFAIVAQSIVQKSQTHCELKGLIEISSNGALPVIFQFTGGLNLENREISILQVQPEKAWSGNVSENGRVIVLREASKGKPMHLIHEQTLEQLI